MLMLKRIRTVEGLSAGSTATVKIPVGMTLHQIFLTMGGDLTKEDIKEIRLVVNGKSLLRYSGGGVELDTINKFDGRTGVTADNILVIDMERAHMLTRQARAVTALGTGLPFDAAQNPFPVATINLELDIAADALPATGAVGLKLDVKGRYSPASVSGVVKKVKPFNYEVAGAGEFEITDIPKGDLINRIFFFSNEITDVTIERDSYVIFEATVAENEIIQDDGIRKPQAGMVVFDPTAEGYGGEGLATRDAANNRIQDLRLRLNMSGASSIKVLVEYIGAIGN